MSKAIPYFILTTKTPLSRYIICLLTFYEQMTFLVWFHVKDILDDALSQVPNFVYVQTREVIVAVTSSTGDG